MFTGSYYKLKFNIEILLDNRMKKLLYYRNNIADDHEFYIGIELKDGKKIGGEVEFSIYNFYNLSMIDNYKIYESRLIYNAYYSKWHIYHRNKISSGNLDMGLNKSSGYFRYNLNNYLDCYDEIKKFIEKIYNEGQIPGKREGSMDMDINEWGNRDELRKYTGYFIDYDIEGEIFDSKTYIEYIGDSYD